MLMKSYLWLQPRLTLVSYDLKTIPPILYKWGEAGTEHGGIIFVDDKSIPPSNFGGLVRSLIWLWDTEQEMDWKNRIFYLQPQACYQDSAGIPKAMAGDRRPDPGRQRRVDAGGQEV